MLATAHHRKLRIRASACHADFSRDVHAGMLATSSTAAVDKPQARLHYARNDTHAIRIKSDTRAQMTTTTRPIFFSPTIPGRTDDALSRPRNTHARGQKLYKLTSGLLQQLDSNISRH